MKLLLDTQKRIRNHCQEIDILPPLIGDAFHDAGIGSMDPYPKKDTGGAVRYRRIPPHSCRGFCHLIGKFYNIVAHGS